MSTRRRVDEAAGRAQLARWEAGENLTARERRAAVGFALEELAALSPGGSVEIRVPPAGVIQAIAGPRHRRGTPPNVVETDPDTWLALAVGRTSWAQALAAGSVRVSGTRAGALEELLPLWGRVG